MNILMVTNTYLPFLGGVSRSVSSFAREYARLGHRVLVIAPEYEGAPAEEEGVVRVPALQKFNGSDFSVRIPIPGYLTATLAEFQPHIVHSHHPFLLGDAALRIAALRGLPLVFTHHTMYESYTHYVGESSAMQRFIVNLSVGYANLCDMVFAPSESVARILARRGVAPPPEVVCTGIDVERFSRGNRLLGRQQMGIPTDAFVVGHLGRLAPEKNLPFLAEAVAAFLRRRADARFLVVGSGPSEASLADAFCRRGLSDRLHMAGSRDGDELVNAYHAMDVFAFASPSETQGLVLAEAMAAALPAVAIDASGVREVIRDRVNGRLLPSQRVRSFAAALDWVAARSAAERERMRSACRETAACYSLDRCARRALTCYERLLADGAARPRSRQADTSVWESAMRLVETEWNLWSTRAQAAGSALAPKKTWRSVVASSVKRRWRRVRRAMGRDHWALPS